MNFAFYTAKRYLISKKKQNIINIISAISVVGVTVGTAALIIVLSVFNGFESLVISLYNSFDPNIKITLKEGKVFSPEAISSESLKKIKGVKYITEVLEDNALLKYRDKQYIATVKGVSTDFVKMTGLDTMITSGKLLLESGEKNYAVIGQGVAYYLSVNTHDDFDFIDIYVPRHDVVNTLSPEEAFTNKIIFPIGIFSIQQDFDAKYVVVPLRFARELFNYEKDVSALEIGLSPDADKEKVQKEIQQLAGKSFDVKNRFQQHKILYKIMKSEKWAVYLILTFILLIATFNIIGSLTMLIIDKKKDIAILHSMGADSMMLRKIFLLEGMLISILGAFSGMFIGYITCWLQQTFGIVKLNGSGSFVISAYPVQMQTLDFVYVLLTVLVIGFMAAWYPAHQLAKKVPSLRE